MTVKPPRILAMWSAPRSRSTAFLRMMVERGDFAVLHEPFSHLADFEVATVDGKAVHTEAELLSAIRAMARRVPVFFKDTTDFRYPGLLADRAFLAEATHTFIIRPPAAIVASHFALNRDLRCEDVGIERLSEIYDAVAAQSGVPPVVISSDDLVSDPEATVRAYCAAIGVPYRDAALSWRPEMLTQWQGTRRWHDTTSRTSGFTAASSAYGQTVYNNPTLAVYAAYHMPFYQRLHRNRLRIGR